MNNQKLHITVGLPGSGKTKWAKDKQGPAGSMRSKGGVLHIEFDKLRERCEIRKRYPSASLTKPDEEMIREYQNNSTHYDDVILDLFVSTNAGIIDLLNKLRIRKNTEVVINYWTPDVDACMHNDRGRRDENSSISITNSTIETPDLARISESLSEMQDVKVSIQTHKTVMKSAWEVFRDEIASKHSCPDRDGKVTSQSWCLGGDWKDCWGGGGTVSGESPVSNFSAFDDIINEVCPHISFMLYKKIWAECVDVDESYDHDYYGGSTKNACYYFRIRDLHSVLVREGLYELKN
jgi:hypothetical protein